MRTQGVQGLVVLIVSMLLILIGEAGGLTLGITVEQLLEGGLLPVAEAELLGERFEGLGVLSTHGLGLVGALQQSGSTGLERGGGLLFGLLEDGELLEGVLRRGRGEDPFEGEVALRDVVLLAELGSLLGRDVQPEGDRLIHAGGGGKLR